MNRTLIALLIAVAPAVLVAQLPEYVPSAGLEFWSDFNGDAEDESLQSVSSSIYGAQPAENRNGEANQALTFDGQDDYVLLYGEEGGVSFGESLTLAAWVRPASSISNGTHSRIFNSTEGVGGGPDRWLFTWSPPAHEEKMQFQVDPSGPYGSTSLTVGEWSHVAVVFNQGQVSFYHNGVADGSAAIASTSLAHVMAPIQIGSANGNSFFHGDIDDVGIWSQALTAIQIETLSEAACNYDSEAYQDDGSCLYPPVIDLGDDIETCEDSVTLDAGEGFGSYLWSTGETSQTITVSESGVYEVSTSVPFANEWALSFSGEGQNVLVPEIEAYERNSHTVSLWCNITDIDGGSDLVSKDDEVNERQWLLQLTNNGEFYGHVWTNNDDLSGIISVTTLAENQWYYLTQTWDGAHLKIYIDGNLEGSISTGSELDGGDYPITIGGDDLGWQSWANGVIDNVAIWDVALTQEQVLNFMNCSPSEEATHLVGLWNFEEGEGVVVYDSSVGENHGAIHGASWSEEVPSQDCLSCESSDEILVDFDDCDGYCGEGTVWDEDLQECIALCDDESDDIVCDCPMQPEIDGFVLFGAFEGSFYYYAADAVSWFEADSMSQANAGHLVTIGSQQERDFLNDQLPWDEPTWIGLTQNLMSEEYSEPDGGWEWVTQEPLNYTDWGLNEPNEASSGEDFGMTQRDNGWNDGHPAIVPFEGTPWGFVMEIECCIQGCTNPMACNYQLEANIDDGSCVSCETLASACGEGTVWDPFIQECIVAIPTDTDFDGCVAAGDLLNLLGTFGSCPPIPFSGPCQGQDHVTYQGHDYEIVAIGDQCWFAENLRFLPAINAPSDRSNDTPKYYIWQYDGANLEEGVNTLEYLERGALYNQPAAIDGCPTGWHLPYKEEMDALSAFAGGDAIAGMALKSEAMGGTNELGLDLDFTGYLNDQGLWLAETRANLWTAAPDPANSENGLYRFVHQNFDSFEETGNRKRAGKGVRCIKDQ